MRALKCRIAGRVQGVWFRAATAERARDLGLTGWVRNLPDGRVEAVVQGPDEALDRMLDWLHQGPPMAAVAAVEAIDQPSAEYTGFDIR